MINPYQSPASEPKPPVVWYRRRRVIGGVVCLAIAGGCVLFTVLGMMHAFQVIADATGSPEPSELATGISRSLLYSIPAAPLTVVGLVLLLLGIRSNG